ncbi:DNA-directed RNA polymerase subunit omega [Paenibacillus turpanensis]|uniref:DNA-directed RNA polymerase subunit omega n=1 Tax=Paenibacillus turpanensis TaxID=2689078 RepID=UPI00140BD727|nr:DNA-directed RNA polymerase subunit omega [Paenibacillus turpanensis]
MLYPSIDTLIHKVESKYLLVTLASKRARMLRDTTKTQVKHARSHKNVGVALEEIYGDYIGFERTMKEASDAEEKQNGNETEN